MEFDFNENLKDYLNFVSENAPNDKIKKGASKALEIVNRPKQNYNGVIDFMNGNRNINNAPMGASSPSGVSASVFDGMNAEKQKQIDAENKLNADKAEMARIADEESKEKSKADKLKNRRMHQQALVSVRYQQKTQPQQNGGGMGGLGAMLGGV